MRFQVGDKVRTTTYLGYITCNEGKEGTEGCVTEIGLGGDGMKHYVRIRFVNGEVHEVYETNLQLTEVKIDSRGNLI